MNIRYIIIFLVLSLAAQVSQAQNLVPNPGFETIKNKLPEGWSTYSPREEISPVFNIDNSMSRSGQTSIKMTSSGKGTYGFWKVSFSGIKSDQLQTETLVTMPDSTFIGNSYYLIGCHFRVSPEVDPTTNVKVKATWLDKENNELFTEFINVISHENGWHRAAAARPAPYNASRLSIILIMQWANEGTVWFDDVFAEKAPPLEHRIIKVAAASSWPGYPSTAEKNLQYYADKIIAAGKKGTDILCLGEGVTMVSTGKNYSEVSEAIPGRTTQILGEAAKKAGIYVIAGIYERDGNLIYNTAILLDRQGNVAGKYRKTHLPQTEIEGGLTPGDTYPVFKTDFGTIGMEICYDNFFPEVSHNLALNGADMIFCPIWGDIRGMKKEWDAVSRTRAIDNSVFFVASMYEKGMSVIIDPNGNKLPDTGNIEGIIMSEVNLNMRTFERWLSNRSFGEWRNLMPNEVRRETY